MTTDHTRIDAALAAYYDMVASLEQSLTLAAATTADMRTQLTQRADEVAALQARLAAMVQTVPIPDFPSLGAGLRLPAVVAGLGRDLTVYRMAPMTSTHAAMVPLQAAGGTNPLSMLVVGGDNASHVVTGIDLSGFALHGTPQGHYYNGLRVGYSTGAKLRNILVKGIPGGGAANPDETFSVNLWHANGAQVNGVVVDGTDDTGARVAASGFGINNLDGATITACAAHGTKYGNAITTYKCTNVVYVDNDWTGCHKPMNWEQNAGGVFRVIRNDLRRPDHLPHMTINSNLGSSKLIITDPIVDAWPLKVGIKLKSPTVDGLYLGKPQTQKVSDVQLIVGGVDVSADPKYLLAGNYW